MASASTASASSKLPTLAGGRQRAKEAAYDEMLETVLERRSRKAMGESRLHDWKKESRARPATGAAKGRALLCSAGTD